MGVLKVVMGVPSSAGSGGAAVEGLVRITDSVS